MRKFLTIVLLGLFFLAGQNLLARAQSAASAQLSLIDPQGFPDIGALLDVFDSEGNFITGLSAQDVTISEDGNSRPVTGLVESAPPVQIVVSVNPGPALAVRNGEGLARYQYIVEALANWAQSRPEENADDLSLVTIAGPLITHADPTDFVVSLTSYQPDFRATTPNIQSLVVALDTVNLQTPQPGMKRSILFITPHMEDPNIDLTLNAIAEQAQSVGVSINVWLVDAEQYFTHGSAVALKSLALQTGGEYFAYSGVESIPDPETYFAPLRHLYTLHYESAITTSGEHTIHAEVETAGETIVSPPQTFSVDVQPPNPILVMPPGQIVRQAPADDPFNPKVLLPEKQEISLIIEFPDGHPRPLVRTTLIVDGEAVAQNETEPFDAFTWDLSAYNESGQHELSVEVVDSLGLSKISVGVPVTVTVVHAPTGFQALLARYRIPITVGAIALAGILLIVILLYGRLRIRSRRERRAARKHYTDPVTQPVAIQQTEKPLIGKQAKRSGRLRSGRVPDAPAYLIRLREDGEPSSGNPIPLVEKEITFGTDPVQASIVLDDPTVSPLHARLRQLRDGSFVLFDQGSVAGTWVNYEPVNHEGIPLKHADVVHFGQLMFRFTLRTPPKIPEPKILPEAPAE